MLKGNRYTDAAVSCSECVSGRGKQSCVVGVNFSGLVIWHVSFHSHRAWQSPDLHCDRVALIECIVGDVMSDTRRRNVRAHSPSVDMVSVGRSGELCWGCVSTYMHACFVQL